MTLKETEGDARRLEDLLENIDDLVALATIEGRMLYVNRAFRERLGYSEGEIEGMSSYQVIHPMHEGDVRAANAKLLAGEPLHNVERTLVAKDGRQFQVEGSISCRFKDGKPYYVRAIFHDITERKKTERMKDELIAIANHEMRSPLMAILTSLQLLREDLASAPDKVRRVFDLAVRNSERLLNLVNAYLDLAKLEAGGAPFRLETLEVSPWAERVLEINRPLGERAGVSLELVQGVPGARVEADADRLGQVLTNLLSNAIKFSKSGSAVRVSLARRGGRLRVSVSDEGPGIPEDFRGKIFGKFAQAEGQAKGGSGLGLAISQAIIERLGGTLGFETSLGRGTTFFFELPERAGRDVVKSPA